MSTTTAPPPSPLRIRFERVVRLEQEVDLAAALDKLTDASRAEYWDMDLHTRGHQEWERPIVWAHEALLDPVLDGEVEDDDVWVVDTRYGLPRPMWTEEAYGVLCGLVPWLAPVAPPTAEDLARTPGPLDEPLPIMTGADR